MGSPLQEAADDEVAGLLVGVGVEGEDGALFEVEFGEEGVGAEVRVFLRIFSMTGW